MCVLLFPPGRGATSYAIRSCGRRRECMVWGIQEERMRRLTMGLAGLCGLLALAACYESDQPLDPTPQVDVDPALLGTWHCTDGEPHGDEKVAIMTVERAGQRLYRAIFKIGRAHV